MLYNKDKLKRTNKTVQLIELLNGMWTSRVIHSP